MNPPNDPFPTPQPGLDAVVRAQLDADAAHGDPAALWDSVQRRLEADAPVPARKDRFASRWKRFAGAAGLAAVAAALLAALFLTSALQQAQASPSEVVRAARAAFIAGDTRCYQVSVVLPANVREMAPGLAAESPWTLRTRGDRFVVTPGIGSHGAYGRDAAGRIWIAPTDAGAAVYEESELPARLRNVVKIHELELGALLDDVLADFDLTWSESPPAKSTAYSIAAVRRTQPLQFGIATAELKIDRDNVIQSLTLKRRFPGEQTAVSTFTLQSVIAADDVVFTPEGHIQPGSPIYDRTKKLERRRFLMQHIGGLANGP